MKKYNALLIDPPWNYEYNQHGNISRGACPYEQMTLEELEKLPINDISDKNCLLFLWTTAPKLKEAIFLMEKWNFRYVTIAFTWIKLNKNNDKIRSGLGYWTNTSTELVLLGKKGKIERINKNIKQAVETIEDTLYNSIGKHSEKPSEIKYRIDKLIGNIPKLEIFARNFVGEEWDYIGNDINGVDAVTAIKEGIVSKGKKEYNNLDKFL